MKIWIDGYEANVKQRLGSSQVAFELLKNIERIDKKNKYEVFLPSSPLEDLPKEREGWKYRVLKISKLWTQVSLPLALFMGKNKPDIFFSPTHYIPRFCPKSIKRICTVFDLSFLHFPEMFTKKDLWQLKNWTKFSVENSAHIITISQFSKKDIIKQYGLDKNKITVAYPGYDKEKFKIQNSRLKIEEIKRKYKTGDNYIIYIGTIQPRKNLIRLMEAFSRVVGEFSVDFEGADNKAAKAHLRDTEADQVQLVIVGKAAAKGRGGWMYEDILQTPQKLRIEKKVQFLGFVPTEDLAILVSQAKGYILPSLWEGFGITVLEAMASGTPVIVSNLSSLPEIVGKAGLLIDPYSLDQIEQALRTVIVDKKLVQKLTKKQLKQAQKFSWQKMAKQVLKVFENF